MMIQHLIFIGILALSGASSSDTSGLLPLLFGEEEVGGTSVLYISDVDLDHAGWPVDLRDAPYPELTAPAMHAVPPTFVGMGALMLGLSWVLGRRRRLEEENRQAEAGNGEEKPSPADAGDGEVQP